MPARGIISVRVEEPKLPRTAVITIVDDDRSVREALTSLVRSLDYVAVAFGTRRGSSKLETAPPRVLFDCTGAIHPYATIARRI